MKTKVLSKLTVLFIIIASMSCLTSCSDDSKKFYKVVNNETFGDVPLYQDRYGDSIVGYLPSRTEVSVFSLGSYGDGHLTGIRLYGDNGLDTVFVPDRFLFTKISEGNLVDKECFYVNCDGNKVKAYSSPQAKNSEVVRVIENDIWLDTIMAGNNDMRLVRFYDQSEAYINYKNLARTTRKHWIAEKTALEKRRGVDKNFDEILDYVEQLQDSDQHYITTTFSAKMKIAIAGILFIISVILFFNDFKEGKNAKWYYSLAVIIFGAALIYYEFVLNVVLGDGYFPAFDHSIFEALDFGWFLNLILGVLVFILYAIFIFAMGIVLVVFQQFITPIIGIAATGTSDKSLVANTVTALLLYTGTIVALIAGVEYYTTIACVTLALSLISIIYSIFIGYSTGNYMSFAALGLPFAFGVSILTTYFIGAYMLYIMEILLIIFVCVGAAGSKSKFQSQDSGKEYRVVGQDGQTKAYLDENGNVK